MKKKISKNPSRNRAYKPRPKTISKFTADFRKHCVEEGLTFDVFENKEMWDKMELVLSQMLIDFIKKSPIV